MSKNLTVHENAKELEVASFSKILTYISDLIESAKQKVATEYNTTHIMLCWLIGKKIDEEILNNQQRANYGEKIIHNLSKELSQKYGKGYSKTNIFRMLKFARLYKNKKIVATVLGKLSWSHLIIICGIESETKRNFLIEMTRTYKWSVRELHKQNNSMLYERTALSKQPEAVIVKQLEKLKTTNQITPEMTFKEPYFLEFIGSNFATEQQLEDLILQNIISFLQELGDDFCFVKRQKRMSTNTKDRYLDLLFFNRRLKRLIAIDLKLGNFEPAYKGQMEWYLNWLDKNERLNHEEKPLGIILCAGKDQEDIEYLEMDKTGIYVATYITDLPPKEILEQKLKKAIDVAKDTYLKKSLILDKANNSNGDKGYNGIK